MVRAKVPCACIIQHLCSHFLSIYSPTNPTFISNGKGGHFPKNMNNWTSIGGEDLPACESEVSWKRSSAPRISPGDCRFFKTSCKTFLNLLLVNSPLWRSCENLYVAWNAPSLQQVKLSSFIKFWLSKIPELSNIWRQDLNNMTQFREVGLWNKNFIWKWWNSFLLSSFMLNICVYLIIRHSCLIIMFIFFAK